MIVMGQHQGRQLENFQALLMGARKSLRVKLNMGVSSSSQFKHFH